MSNNFQSALALFMGSLTVDQYGEMVFTQENLQQAIEDEDATLEFLYDVEEMFGVDSVAYEVAKYRWVDAGVAKQSWVYCWEELMKDLNAPEAENA